MLIVDEAVTNAVEHARSEEHTCQVELVAGPRACGGGIAVRVTDNGAWRDPPADPGSRGRGVQLMGRLADRSSITTGDDGTNVRMCWSTGAGVPSPARLEAAAGEWVAGGESGA